MAGSGDIGGGSCEVSFEARAGKPEKPVSTWIYHDEHVASPHVKVELRPRAGPRVTLYEDNLGPGDSIHIDWS